MYLFTQTITMVTVANIIHLEMPYLLYLPITPSKNLLKGDMYWFFPGKMLPCISALHWAR